MHTTPGQAADSGIHGIELRGVAGSGKHRLLTPEALAFVADLTRRFRSRIAERMDARRARQVRFDQGELPNFLSETRDVRGDASWRVAPAPSDLTDRRVEITGPVDRKMIINALNSGANVFMADFEDATSPTWQNLIEGQQNLCDAVRRRIRYEAPDTGKTYALKPSIATLVVRPRGLHLPERHLWVDGEPVPGALFDFGLFFFHNAAEQLARGTGPYFYLPKLESHLEARLWNDVFLHAQARLNIPKGTIRATVLIETLPAAFEMEEILYELRDHSAGLNCGRWDYIFSFIKTLRAHERFLLPDRAKVTMDRAFLQAYSRLLIQTCHRRGAHAMGGMAAQIPNKRDPEANEQALDRVRADKLREVREGHDGTWVAHPGLVTVAREVFDQGMRGPHQIDRLREDVAMQREHLLEVHKGARTEQGLRQNVRVGLRYLESWLRGVGCVPLYGLMEDAATAEISRAQVWQWLRFEAQTDDGLPVTRERVQRVIEEEAEALRREAKSETDVVTEAVELFKRVATGESLENFLTLPAYERLLESEQHEEER